MADIDVVSPVDGSSLGKIPVNSKQEVNSAVEKALAVEPLPRALRSEILLAAAQKVMENIEDLSSTIHREQGKSQQEAGLEVLYTSKLFKATAAAMSEYNGRVIESMLEPDKKRIIERYEPMGVVGIISPFNFPLLLPAYLIAPALAAGNSIVFKPSELSPFSGMKLVGILNEIEVEDEFLGKAKLPENTLNTVTGGSSTGRALVEHKDISMVGFTGSVETGKDIIRSSGKEGGQPKRLLLELGGNCPAVVFDDADLDRAAELCAYGSFTYCGEVCISTQRIYVHEKIYDEFLKKLIAAKDEFKPGPIRTKEFLGNIQKFIDDAEKKGAKIYGGNSQGLTLEPTVIEMSHDMLLAREEVFAPVVGVMPFKTEDEAIILANSARHGLSAAVFTKDLAKGMRVAESIKSGTVVINDTTQWFEPHIAFGGYKWSGLGREGGFHAIREFSRIKTIVLDISE